MAVINIAVSVFTNEKGSPIITQSTSKMEKCNKENINILANIKQASYVTWHLGGFKPKPVWLAWVDGPPQGPGGQDAQEEDVGEEGEVGEHQDRVETHLA